MNTTDIIDYGASFLVGKWPENEVRFWVESRTLMWDETKGWNEIFHQCGACKSENTFAARGLFHTENYNFTPVFGKEYGVIFRRKAGAHAGYREVKAADAMWGGVIEHLRVPRRVSRLETPEEIADATHQGLPLVGRTRFRQGSANVVIEYPIKTMNIHRGRRMFQVDTGPIAFPDLHRETTERPVDSIALAYVAFNAWDFAEFIVESRTRIAKEGDSQGVEVHHYSRILELEAENALYAAERPM